MKKNANKCYLICSYELNARSVEAKILSFDFVSPTYINGQFDYKYSQILCGIGDQDVSSEAFEHHGISANSLVNLPAACQIDFPHHKFLIVWDGNITRQRFKFNKVHGFSSNIISLHNLVRFTTEHCYKLKLKDALNLVLPKGSFDFINTDYFLLNHQNKVRAIGLVFDYIRQYYCHTYGICSLFHLVRISNARTKKEFKSLIVEFADLNETI